MKQKNMHKKAFVYLPVLCGIELKPGNSGEAAKSTSDKVVV